MPDFNHTNVISLDGYRQRAEHGLWVPMESGDGLQTVHCGEHNPPTAASLELLSEGGQPDDTDGRYFGAALGLSATALTVIAAQIGQNNFGSLVSDYGHDLITDFAADVSDRAYRQSGGKKLAFHSSETNEGNPVTLVEEEEAHKKEIACSFALYLGQVIWEFQQPETLELAIRMQDLVGQSGLPFEAVQEGAQLLSQYVTSEYEVSRRSLHRAMRTDRVMPISIHRNMQTPVEELHVVHDLAGLRSSASGHHEAGIPNWHHTASVASDTLPEILPEFHIDEDLSRAAAVMLGIATHTTLEKKTGQPNIPAVIVPQEYSQTFKAA